MAEVLALVERYELWLYGLLGLLGLVYGRIAWAAAQRLDRTPFGLEKDDARRRLNGALVVLFGVVALGSSVFILNRYVAPSLTAASATPAPDERPTAIPTPTLIGSGVGPLVVDSSGCDQAAVALVRPQPGERITGSYEIVGTASLPNFAFYRVEISGAATNGAWVTLAVGNVPAVESPLGLFDTSPYAAGEYAFRLVVTDNVGQEAPPCVIVVNLSPGALPTPAAP
jgi:hypothetical protein